MNYTKLKLSFLCLIAMSVIQFLVSAFILHNMLITVLSAIAIILCGLGIWYVGSRTSNK